MRFYVRHVSNQSEAMKQFQWKRLDSGIKEKNKMIAKLLIALQTLGMLAAVLIAFIVVLVLIIIITLILKGANDTLGGKKK